MQQRRNLPDEVQELSWRSRSVGSVGGRGVAFRHQRANIKKTRDWAGPRCGQGKAGRREGGESAGKEEDPGRRIDGESTVEIESDRRTSFRSCSHLHIRGQTMVTGIFPREIMGPRRLCEIGSTHGATRSENVCPFNNLRP